MYPENSMKQAGIALGRQIEEHRQENRRAVSTEPSPPAITNSLDHLYKELDRLGGMVANLENKLTAVMVPMPQAVANGAGLEKASCSSPVADRIQGAASITRNIQERVAHMLATVEL